MQDRRRAEIEEKRAKLAELRKAREIRKAADLARQPEPVRSVAAVWRYGPLTPYQGHP